MNKEKILLLGGSAQQVVAIETAKRMGYYTILCDYLPDNPGQFVADKFYLLSTTDKEQILFVAKQENIHGIIAYASDPAAPTAAYVAEKLNLAGNPYESVDILCNKDKFRLFLEKNGFNAPKSYGCANLSEISRNIECLRLPVIVKPVDSSGSKGATVLRDWKCLEEAAEYAFSFSRNHRIIVEEYIEKKHKYLIGGDVFIQKGKIILWGLLNCHRDNKVNSLVPVGKSYPLQLDEEDIIRVKDTLQCMVDRLGLKNGAMNVELVVDYNNRVWPIDVGPRNGGNMIPDLLGMIYDVDIVEMSVNVAMGKNINMSFCNRESFFATHNLHADKDGYFDKIKFSEKLNKRIIKQCIYKKSGDVVEYFDNASKALGIIFLKFDNGDDMEEILSNINEHICIELQ